MWVTEVQDGIIIKVKVQPRASKNKVAGILGDVLKICLTAPPVDGEANEALTRFLADLTGVSRSNVEIMSGYTGRNKHIKVFGMKLQKFCELAGVEV